MLKGLKNLFTVVLIVVLTFVVYQHRVELQARFRVFSPAPCSQPISYKVGSFDNRFGISQDKFKEAIAAAANIWNTAAGKQLFIYKDDGSMPVNLIFDSRQEAANQLKKLNLGVDNTQASYNTLKAKYIQDKAQYQAEKQQIDSLQQEYNNLKAQYEQDHQESQREQLNALAAQINNLVVSLNQLVSTINALAENLNRIGSELNLDVSAYNAVGKNLGEFEEGLYTQDALGQRIDIYEFDNYQMLVRVLTHELGHSLGMDHVDDKDAIMYRLNQSKNEKPTAADLAELKRVCKF